MGSSFLQLSVREGIMASNETTYERTTMIPKRVMAATLVPVLTIAAGLVQWELLIRDIERRFPHLDPNKLRKAYFQFMKHSLTGQLGDIDDYTDEQMDQLFLLEYDKIQ